MVSETAGRAERAAGLAGETNGLLEVMVDSFDTEGDGFGEPEGTALKGNVT